MTSYTVNAMYTQTTMKISKGEFSFKLIEAIIEKTLDYPEHFALLRSTWSTSKYLAVLRGDRNIGARNLGTPM